MLGGIQLAEVPVAGEVEVIEVRQGTGGGWA